jgi:hypothetical protein
MTIMIRYSKKYGTQYPGGWLKTTIEEVRQLMVNSGLVLETSSCMVLPYSLSDSSIPPGEEAYLRKTGTESYLYDIWNVLE